MSTSQSALASTVLLTSMVVSGLLWGVILVMFCRDPGRTRGLVIFNLTLITSWPVVLIAVACFIWL